MGCLLTSPYSPLYYLITKDATTTSNSDAKSDEPKVYSWYISHSLTHFKISFPMSKPINLIILGICERKSIPKTSRLRIKIVKQSFACQEALTECSSLYKI